MIVEALPMEITAEDFSEATGSRSPGLHLSQILTELNIARGGTTYPETDAATKQNYFAMGFIWEQILTLIFRETALKKKAGTLVRPGEFVLNGVATSPDALDLGDYALEEYKATYLSSAKPIDHDCFWPWIVQMKCYCKVTGTRTARLRVFFIVGDWRGSGPQVRCWQFHFTDRDVDEAWAMVLNTAKSKGWL
jgi:hypothetical protein